MKKLILCAVVSCLALAGRAQEESGERSEWLPAFTEVSADGSFDLELVAIPDTEAPRVIYDTRGSYTTKFRAEVKDRVLHMRERTDTRRPERTRVTVYYNSIRAISAANAAVTIADTLAQKMFDISLSGNARLTAALEVTDLDISLTDRSTAQLTGTLRYLTLFASGAKFDCSGLTVESARINAQSNASVKLTVTDRLEGKTSTGGTIRYKGEPEIIRSSMKFMAGDIKSQEQEE